MVDNADLTSKNSEIVPQESDGNALDAHAQDIINAVMLGENVSDIASRWGISSVALGQWLDENRKMVESAFSAQEVILRAGATRVLLSSLTEGHDEKVVTEEIYDKDGLLAGTRKTVSRSTRAPSVAAAKFVAERLDPARFGDKGRDDSANMDSVQIVIQ